MTKDEKFLAQARERFDLAATAQQSQRQREVEDLKFYAGEQWPSDLLKAREGVNIGGQIVPARPSLVINKTIEPVRQIINQEREADLGYELVPADDFGEVTGPIDHTEIDLREGLVRRIQRDSEAEDARTWAFQRAAIAGSGYRLVNTRYLPGKRADQEVYIERIFDQTSVLLDPSREQPDGSDAAWGFYGQDMLQSAFKAEYPHAKVSKITDDGQWRTLVDSIPGWFAGDGDKKPRSIRVMNYYYTEYENRKLYHLINGAAVYGDELESVPPDQFQREEGENGEPGEIVTHTETSKKIYWCKMVGNEVLDKTEWPGRWIPIIEEVGEELQPYDQERRRQGIVRPMRDSCKATNYLASKYVEYQGLQPIPPWIMAAGQDEGFTAEWQAANTRTLSTLHYNQKDSEGQLAPPPQRVSITSDVSGMALGMQIFGQATQSTSAVPETSLGNTDPTVKSGKLARALIEQGDRSTSNFMDNHKRSLRHEARVVNDLLYPTYGGRIGRMVKIQNGQGEVESILIGQPFVMQGQGKEKRPMPVPEGQPVPKEAKVYKLTPDADFNVAVKITKNIDTRRQQIVNVLGEIISADPQQMGVIGDKIWKYLDVPDHAEIEERYKVMLVPPIQKLLSGQSPLPPEAQQKIAMLEAQIQEMMPLVDKNKSDLMKTEMQQKADNERTLADIQSREKIERWKIEANLEIEMAKLGNANMMRRAEIDADLLHAHRESDDAKQQQAAQFQQEQQMAERQAQQAQQQQGDQALADAALAEQGQQHALEQGEQQQQGALTQQQLQHQQTLEQQAAQPAPTTA